MAGSLSRCGALAMTGSDPFHFSDFTRANYRRLLRLAKAKYPFTTFPEADLSGRFLLWRHDVDFSIHAAEKLAQIEAEEGVVATYFVLIHCRYYNLFEREIRAKVQRILALGHQLGLHLEMEFHNVADKAGLEAALILEQRWLEDLFGVKTQAFSFHDPNPFSLSFRADRYAGMINTYAEPFQSSVGYCSDSNGYWRHRRLEDVLTAATDERLQVLTHPECWQEEPMSPRRRVHRCIDGRADYLKRSYDATLQQLGRLNVDDAA
jgi:hypothetical protein